MPLKTYGVLVGQVVASRAEGGADTPHFQIRIQAGGTEFRVAVNVMSQQSPSELLYIANEAFKHPLVEGLRAVDEGFTPVASQPGGIALDFIRGNLFDRRDMRLLPAEAPGPENDLADKLDHYVSRAQADPTARVFAFGEHWGPEAQIPDKVFDFKPGNGVHDIHMNQGNSGQFRRDDGVWQDGGLLLHDPGTDQWVAIFLAFQSQIWHTDDQTGEPLPDVPEPGPGPEPGPSEPDHIVRIVAAVVNPIGPAPEQETVTLINTSSQDLDLSGWALLDRLEHRMVLDATQLPAGEARRIALQPPVQLGNSGGLITLVNAAELKVDGVAYTDQQAASEGRSIVF
jgi:uncharacterized protein YukJ